MSAQTDLIAKLQEIFQTDRADLDFGIYRILNTRRDEINGYLKNTLPAQIKEALAGSDAQETAVYNHLLTFFSRYYEEGDFISQRRYKGDTYAIPYNGEEVLLHWANKDQYYTKSGENFSNYRFTLAGEKRVFFKLVAADTAKDNQKDNEKSRLFVLAQARGAEYDDEGEEIRAAVTPISTSPDGKTLTICFAYQSLPKSDKQAAHSDAAIAAIRAHEAVQRDWAALFERAPTDKDPNRTLLAKHLSDYTQKNSADYFIHKDLGGFLKRELDFYIKNEMMNLDNIQHEGSIEKISQSLKQIQTLREIAQNIIAFLAQLENFQKKLWLKKKFVVGHHYLITLNHILALDNAGKWLEEIFANDKQRNAWENLFAFKVLPPSPDLISFAESNPYLILDTSLFPPEFQTRLLSALSDSQSLDTATDGLLIHSDNFQALNLLQARYREQVKCIYIDPPYNTEEDRAKGKFIYKDGFPSSSWATLVHNRLCLSKNLLQQSGVIYQSIDDNEQTRLKLITDNLLGEKNFLADMIILTGANQSGEGVNIQVNNEYCLAHALNKDKVKIYHIDEVNETLRNLNDAPTPLHTRVDMGYTIYFNPNTQDLIPLMDYDKDKIYLNDEKQVYKNNENLINQGYIPIRAGKRSNFLHRWRWGFDSFIERKDEIIIRKSKDKYNVFFKQFGFNAPKNIINVSSGTVELKNIFSGNSIFSNPKNTSLIHRLVSFSTNKTDLILDYFAGSGTTAHAVINLNREDGGKRKYILVEQGEYFNTVLKPRIEKAVYSAEWKDGKPVADKDSGSLNGISQMVKVLKLESYEDTLNNLVLQNKGDLLSGLPESAQQDYLLHYMLDVESRDSLLSTDAFQKPFAYCLNIAADSAGAYDSTPVDLVETFNYLLGLRVQAVEDKRFSEGYVLVEGWLKHPNEKILVVWRDCEIWGYDRLPELLKKKRVNPQDSEYDAVYINGDHTLPTAWQSDDGAESRTLKILPIEAEFLRLMFAEA